MKLGSILVLLVLLGNACFPAYVLASRPEMGHVTVRVVDGKGLEVPDAYVYVSGPGTAEVAEGAQNQMELLPGRYHFRSAYILKTLNGLERFLSYEASVDVEEGQNENIVLSLHALNPDAFLMTSAAGF